jgi:hypothetical protein
MRVCCGLYVFAAIDREPQTFRSDSFTSSGSPTICPSIFPND